SHLGGYITGEVSRPDARLDPTSAYYWDMNNRAIIGSMRLKCTLNEGKFINAETNAKVAWSTMLERHVRVRPIEQILLIQQVFALRYHRSVPLSDTSAMLSDLVRRIFAIGIPTKDTFLSAAMLHALSGDLSNVHDQVVNLLAASTHDSPFTSADIRHRLDIEQQI
ncbi:hypothetical protein BV22DRAFT_977518, partial [Leucogyrophana mollusca]